MIRLVTWTLWTSRRISICDHDNGCPRTSTYDHNIRPILVQRTVPPMPTSWSHSTWPYQATDMATTLCVWPHDATRSLGTQKHGWISTRFGAGRFWTTTILVLHEVIWRSTTICPLLSITPHHHSPQLASNTAHNMTPHTSTMQLHTRPQSVQIYPHCLPMFAHDTYPCTSTSYAHP